MTPHDRSDGDPLDQAMTDGHPVDAGPTGFNILRGKTFNEDLRKLIHRIEDHESDIPSAGEDLSRGRLHEITEEELIRKFHRLHYRIDNIDEHMQSHAAFNPFRHISQDVTLPEQIIAQEIGSILARLGYESYTIMRYSMPDRCFRPFINRVPFLPDDDFILSLEEPLYQKITAAAHGTVLDKSDFTGDAFLKRTMDLSEFRDDRVILAVQCLSLVAGILIELGMTGEGSRTGFIPSPLLLLYYDPKRFTDNPGRRIKTLAGTLAVPLLLLLADEPQSGQREESSESLLEQLIPLCFLKPWHRCVLVRCSAEDVSGYFLIKFLYEKLLRILDLDSSVLLVRPRSLFLIIMDDNIQTVQKTIEQWNILMKDPFVFSVYNSSDFHHPADLLKIVLLNI